MAIPEHIKRRSMDAISHPETQAHRLLFWRAVAPKSPSPVRPPGLIPADAKRSAMDAISNAATVAQRGLIKATGGVALYTAHIRQMDQENRRDAMLNRMSKPPNKTREGLGRE